MKSNSIEFDLINSNLGGRNLIESSAGTGKTYTISRLFLRLVLEKRIEISKILVVTFTEAATEELRQRIRDILNKARKAFETGGSDDKFLMAMLTKCDSSRCLELLNDALRDFDTAGIFTIHGFCQRVLYENAFESGQTLDAQIIKDQSDLLKEIVEDFWRAHFYLASPLFIAYCVDKKLGPESFSDGLKTFIGPQDIKIIPEISKQNTVDLENSFISSIQNVSKSWIENKIVIQKLLIKSNLNKKKYSEKIVNDLFISLETMLKSNAPGPMLFKGFEKLTHDTINASMNKGCNFQCHEFFDSCEALLSVAQKLQKTFDEHILYLNALFLRYANQELINRKEKQNILYFDDLLAKVSKALEKSKKSFGLVQSLRNAYKAALIDEFQDTDPIQYGIFNSIFQNDSILFLIGDPKQAIYSFRGADIFAYLKASNSIENRFTLTKNYRSQPGLLHAINVLFTHQKNPFVFDDIEYKNVSAATELLSPVSALPENETNFKLWIAQRGDPHALEAIPVFKAREMICKAIAFEISHLLLKGPNIKPFQIAILVRKNKEAELIQNTLSNYNIPSTLESSGNVFDSPESLEILRLLQGICNWTKPQLLKAATTTCFFSYNAVQIHELNCNEHAWEDCVSMISRYYALWLNKGFVPMVRTLMSENKVQERLMSYFQGERRITNILHLVELIHEEEIREKHSPNKLCAWLFNKINDNKSATDEELLRLETDDNAVRIMTIHKSKGLEFPIVFCPFSWASSEIPANRKNSPLLFHDSGRDFSATLALGQEAIHDHKTEAEKESLAENIRLLYVALTRAKMLCYCVWGPFRGAETSALAYILHGKGINAPLVQNLSAKLKSLSDDQIFSELRSISEISPKGAFKIEILPDKEPTPLEAESKTFDALILREFTRPVPGPWKIASFSSLSYHYNDKTLLNPELMDSLDSDTLISEKPSDPVFSLNKPEGIFAFPKGALSGVFLHDVLEHTDFTNIGSPKTTNVILDTLAAHGFDLSWKPTIEHMLKNLVSVQLFPENNALRLCNIPRSDCLHELEFYFPLDLISSNDINSIVSNAHKGIEHAFQGLQFKPVQGYMKGFMDLVFTYNCKYYLIDWKSNFLGNSIEDYSVAKITEVMHEQCYNFQYHIYITALHMYLLTRMVNYDYDKHFGGVLYIFLRGVDAEKGPEYGVFFDRPSIQTIKRLCKTLIRTDQTHQ